LDDEGQVNRPPAEFKSTQVADGRAVSITIFPNPLHSSARSYLNGHIKSSGAVTRGIVVDA
jgi:hypothetical protein